MPSVPSPAPFLQRRSVLRPARALGNDLAMLRSRHRAAERDLMNRDDTTASANLDVYRPVRESGAYN
jgi:hypothetical protein